MTGQIGRVLADAIARAHRACAAMSDAVADWCRATGSGIERTTREIVDADHDIAVPLRRFTASDAERALRDGQFHTLDRIEGLGANEVYRAESVGGFSIYKPAAGEQLDSHGIVFPARAGENAKREVAAYRVNELLGFELVPPTAMVDGPYGPGSNQRFVHSRPSAKTDNHPQWQIEQMAVLDYVTGNYDRSIWNWRVAPDGRLVAIDHGRCFPERPGGLGIQSDFVEACRDRPLSPEVLDKVRAVNPEELRAALHELELSNEAIEHTVARLTEIQDQGRIVGRDWLSDQNRKEIQQWGLLDSPVVRNKNRSPG